MEQPGDLEAKYGSTERATDVWNMWEKTLFPLTLLPKLCGAYHSLDVDVGPRNGRGHAKVDDIDHGHREHRRVFLASFFRVNRLFQIHHFIMTVVLFAVIGYNFSLLSLYWSIPSGFDWFVINMSGAVQAAANNAAMFWNCCKKNRFRRFALVLSSYVAICEASGVRLSWRRVRIRAALVAALSLVLLAGVGIIPFVTSKLRYPVNYEDTPLRLIIIELILQSFAVFAVLINFFTPSLFAVFCYYLSDLFAELTDEFVQARRRGSVSDKSILDSFRLRHDHICQLVDIVDEAFSPIVGITFVTNTSSTLFLGYHVLSEEHTDPFHVWQQLTTLGFSASIILVFSISAALLHEQAHSLRRHVHELRTEVFDPEIAQVQMLFLARLDGADIGMTALGCYVITKERVLTVLSGLITYFTILLQFKDTCAPSDVTAVAQISETTDVYTAMLTT